MELRKRNVAFYAKWGYCETLACATHADGNVDNGAPSYTRQARVAHGRVQEAVFDHKHVGGVRLRHEPISVQHERVSGARLVGLDLRKNIIEHVAIVAIGVQKRGRIPPQRGGDEFYPLKHCASLEKNKR